MKRYLALLCLVLLVLLCGCGREPASTVYEKDGYTVDTQAQTITKGEDVIRYSFGSNGTVTFTYPDNTTTTWTQNGNFGSGTSSLLFDSDRWPTALDLINVLDRDDLSQPRTGNPLGLLLIPLGILQAVFPQAFWFLNHGWKYKDAEPSELALGLGRVGGALVAIIGLIMLL